LNTLDYIFLIGDFTVALLLLIGFYLAKIKNQISREYYLLFWIGCLIGSIWEFTFLILGPEFLHSVKEWPYGLGGWPRKISHSVWDGGLFMMGIYFCEKYLPKPLFRSFNKNELFVMVSWGISQELLVEYLFNGRVWIYEPLPWNPIIIPTIPGSAPLSPGYTLIPQAVWIVAPILFYFICLRLINNAKR